MTNILSKYEGYLSVAYSTVVSRAGSLLQNGLPSFSVLMGITESKTDYSTLCRCRWSEYKRCLVVSLVMSIVSCLTCGLSLQRGLDIVGNIRDGRVVDLSLGEDSDADKMPEFLQKLDVAANAEMDPNSKLLYQVWELEMWFDSILVRRKQV